MSDLIKKVKIKKQDGTYTDYIPIGAEAKNVDCSDGESVEYKLNKKPYYYNSVADMKTDTSLKVGDMAITLGYYEANDGGGAEYKIIKGTYIDNGGSYHKLNNNLYAELIIKDNIIVNCFGAKHNGEDDAIYFNRMLNCLNYIKLGKYNYTIKTSINLGINQSMQGINYNSKIIINDNANQSIFNLTKNNDVSNLSIVVNKNNWSGNIFELSSKTLQNHVGLIKYENLKINLHNIDLTTSSGTFLYLWASNIDENNTIYDTYGLWNINVYNINHHGYLNYIERTYAYNNSGSNAWITKNVFRDCVFDSVEYGWYGNKNDTTFSNNYYQTQNITIINCTVQCGTDSKNFVYATGEGTINITGSIPYDWGQSNPGYKPIKIKNNILTGKLNILNNSFNEDYINFIQFTNNVNEDLYTYLGDYLQVGGVSFKYKFRPIHLQMGVGTATNYLVYKIGELDMNYIKRNFNFELYFFPNLPITNLSINIDYQGNCTVYYDKLSGLLNPNIDFKVLKKNNELFIAFKYKNNYAFLRQKPYPNENNPYFLDLHITKIGDVNISEYNELTLTQF